MSEEAIAVVALPQEVALVVHQSGLEADSELAIQTTFAPLFAQAKDWEAKVATIHVTDASQVREMKLARESRLALKEIRVIAEKNKKRLKEDSLKRGRAIDFVYSTFEGLVKPLEEKLKEQEEFIVRQEASRKAKLKAEREEALRPFGVDTQFFQLGEMPESAWVDLLKSVIAADEAKKAEAAKVEAERIAKEKVEAEERERIRVENERLKAEAAERDRLAQIEAQRIAAERAAADAAAKAEREKYEAEMARQQAEARRIVAEAHEKARKEREAAEAKAKAERLAIEAQARAEQEKAQKQAEAERAAREKAEAETKRLRDAEEAKKAADLEERRQAELAPDKEKLLTVAKVVRAINVPAVSDGPAKIAAEQIAEQIGKFAAWIETRVGKL